MKSKTIPNISTSDKQEAHKEQTPKPVKFVAIFMIIGVIAIIVSPFLFTRASVFSCLDFSNTGQIGDTIGGITAPIVGLISIVLLYLTLKEQQRFNIKQQDHNRINQILAIQNDLNSLNDRIKYCYFENEDMSNHKTGAGLLQLRKLTQTNETIRFHYVEMNGLFRECVVANILCKQIIDYSSGLDKNVCRGFQKLVISYSSSITEFAKSVVDKKIKIVSCAFDSACDEENKSEIDNLLNEFKEEFLPHVESSSLPEMNEISEEDRL